MIFPRKRSLTTSRRVTKPTSQMPAPTLSGIVYNLFSRIMDDLDKKAKWKLRGESCEEGGHHL